ncbi:MAG TPA: hypothetical protein VIL00_17610 [Pseudonocardiaceae bacterium]
MPSTSFHAEDGSPVAGLAEAAAEALRRFRRRNVRVPGSRVVHAMRPTRFLGVEVPGLACGTAVGGWDWARLVPVVATVTCAHCLRSPQARAAAALVPEPPAQLALDLDAGSRAGE